jgi:hypothetical protein
VRTLLKVCGAFCFLLIIVAAPAQSFHVTLMNEVSSKMKSGESFTAKDETSGRVYTGRVITQRARNFLRRGWIRLSFDQSIRLVDPNGEGVMHPNRKKQLILLGTTPLIAKIADDTVDASLGAGKARLVAAGAAGVALFFMNGGNITLKPGYKLQVEPDR